MSRLLPGAWREDDAGRVEMIGQRCGRCGTLTFPPASACPHCWERQDLTTEPLAGPATVHAFSVVHVPEDGIPAPYVIGLIDFADGVRVCGRLSDADGLALGAPVRVVAATLRDRGEASLRGWMFEPA